MKLIKQLDRTLHNHKNHLFFKIALWMCLFSIIVIAFSPLEHTTLDHHDKLNHILAFWVLSFLIDFAYPKVSFYKYKLISLLVYGCFIEVVQHFLPYRTFSMLDIAADLVGVLFYIIVKRRLIAIRSLS